jgi:tetratricopeptide (TPR) repeat protein
VLRHFSKLIVTIVVAALTSGIVWGQAAEKKWKDQAEYDVYIAITKEADGNKALGLLNTWKQKYAETDFKEERIQLYLRTYQKLNQGENMLKTAEEWMGMNPKVLEPMWWATLLTVSLNNTAPDRLALGEKASRGVLAHVESELTAAKRPPATSEADWEKQRTALSTQAIKTLGWIEMSRKNHTKAEEEFTRFLKTNPNSGVISYWLATVMLAQGSVEKQVPALYHFARAGNYTGEDALAEPARKQIKDFFERNYRKYHGSDRGMKEVVDLALKNPFPPGGFEIKSEQQLIVEEENRLKQENPQLAVWLGIKKNLLGPEGPAFFESMKGAALAAKLKGKVVNQTPARRPKEITLALSTDNIEEIKLVLDAPMAGPAPPGTEIEFENAVSQAFTSDPFLLTLEVEKSNVTGWPAAAAPPGGKKAGTKGKAKGK